MFYTLQFINHRPIENPRRNPQYQLDVSVEEDVHVNTDQTPHYNYHHDYDHITEECLALKDKIED